MCWLVHPCRLPSLTIASVTPPDSALGRGNFDTDFAIDLRIYAGCGSALPREVNHMSVLSRCAAVGVSCVALAGLSPVLAGATPPDGVTAETLAHVSFPLIAGSAEFAGTDFTARRITIAPGGTTGWHYHDGPVYAYVESGVLTRTLHDCTRVSTPAGQVVAEEVDASHVHQGANLGDVPVVLYAAYIEPPGKPFAEDAPAPLCAG